MRAHIACVIDTDVCQRTITTTRKALTISPLDQAGSGTCTDCPAGKHQATEGSIACDNCEAGKFKAAAGVNIACDNCVPGKFKAAGVNTACDSCQAGKYQATVGATSESDCTSCPDNANSPQGSAAATACACNAGYTGANGGTCSGPDSCTYANDGVCNEPQYCAVGTDTSDCSASSCEAGNARPVGGACAPCAAGIPGTLSITPRA
jgi:hypothetical protein